MTACVETSHREDVDKGRIPDTLYRKMRKWTPFPCADIVVWYKNMVLILYRAISPICWALPGGRIHYGETPEEAARRELFEETGIKAIEFTGVGVFNYVTKQRHDVCITFSTIVATPNVSLDFEHKDYRWVYPGKPGVALRGIISKQIEACHD